MESTPTNNSSSYYHPLIRIQDVLGPGGTGISIDLSTLPPHLGKILFNIRRQDKVKDELISIHEFGARVCHVLLVEAGFFPVDGVGTGTGIERVEDLVEMEDGRRIPEFVDKLSPSSCLHPEVYSIKYKYVRCDEVKNEEPEVTTGTRTEDSTGNNGGDTSSTDLEEDSASVKRSRSSNNEDSSEGAAEDKQVQFKYSLSEEEVMVTMLILEDRLSLTAVSPKTPHHSPISFQFTLNIEEFFTQKTKTVPHLLRPEDWIRHPKFDINYTRLSVYFKNKVAIPLLDMVGGVVYERRGILGLPHLVLLQVLKKMEVKNILALGKTCVWFYDVVMDNRLWKYLLKRDFSTIDPPDPHTPRNMLLDDPPSFVTVVRPPPPSLTSNKDKSSLSTSTTSSSQQEEPDYYEIYKQKYIERNRRLLRFGSFPGRFWPNFRIGRRVPSVPFHPFPFAFRQV